MRHAPFRLVDGSVVPSQNDREVCSRNFCQSGLEAAKTISLPQKPVLLWRPHAFRDFEVVSIIPIHVSGDGGVPLRRERHGAGA